MFYKIVKIYFAAGFIIVGIGGLFFAPFGGLLYIILGLFLIPPISEKIKSKVSAWSKKSVRVAAIIGLYLVGSVSLAINLDKIFQSSEEKVETLHNAEDSKETKSFKLVGEQGEAKTEYQIIKAENTLDIKYTYEIRLSNNKLSENELKMLALNLKSELDKPYERIFITYYLPDDEVGSGAWAISHFNPDLKVAILGLTENDVNDLEELKVVKDSEELIGRWVGNAFGEAFFYVLVRREGKLFLAMRDAKDSIEKEMLAKKVNGQIQYHSKDENRFGEYYVINSEGELEAYDSQGYIEKYLP